MIFLRYIFASIIIVDRLTMEVISSMSKYLIFISLCAMTIFVNELCAISPLFSTSSSSSPPSYTAGSNDHTNLPSSSRSPPHHHGWRVEDWWQTNIKEDLISAFKSPQNLISEAPMSRFVRLADYHDYYSSSISKRNFNRNDLDTSESNPEPVTVEYKENVARFNRTKSYFMKKRKPEQKRRYVMYQFGLPSILKPLSAQKMSRFNNRKMVRPHSKQQQTESSNMNYKVDWDQESDQSTQAELFIPTSSLSSIKSFYYDYFTNVRTNTFDPHSFVNLKRNLRAKFIEYGLQTAIQLFYFQKRRDKGHNIVGIYPSIYRNTSRRDEDSVLVIGAHYDTVPSSPGVEDNGSGSVAVLELARLLNKHQCKLNTTIIFVLFDMEEDGLYGSKNFVKNYLIPVEVVKHRVPVKGAFIIDMLLEYDTAANSQLTQLFGTLLPEWNDRVRQNRYRGDFAAVWARRDIDSELYRVLEDNWVNRQKYKLFLMDPPLPRIGRDLTTPNNSLLQMPYSTFLRSDHASFWYPHSLKNETVHAILLTDLGPWRQRTADKYHSPRDNSKLLTRGNLLFLKNGIDSLMRTILDIGQGYCREFT